MEIERKGVNKIAVSPVQIVVLTGASLIVAAVMWYVADYIIDELNVTGGLWTVGLLMLSIVVVAFVVIFVLGRMAAGI
jgi:hypothetical protein